MAKKPYYSIIIPAKDEHARLPITLIDVDRHLANQDKSYEIIVALSPSSDNTQEILTRFERLLPNLKLVILKEDLGKGHAITQAIKKASGDWLILMDADNAISVTELTKASPYLGLGSEKKAKYHDVSEVVIGSRYAPGSHHDPKEPFTKRWFYKIFRLFTRILITNQTDPNPKFLVISRALAVKTVPHIKITKWLVPLELITLAKKQGISPIEFPVFYSNDSRYKSHKSLFQLKLDWWRVLFLRLSSLPDVLKKT